MTEPAKILSTNELAEIAPQSSAITPMAMISQALASSAPMETLDKLMALQERWDANQARKAFDAAMSEMRADLPEILKTSTVDFTHDNQRTHYKYEDLNAVTAAVSPAMAKHGLAFRWRLDQDEGNVIVTCVVSHRDGHYEETTLKAAPDTSGKKSGIKATGSTVTYLQRYTLKAAIGVAAAHDDDAIKAESQEEEYDTTPWTEQIIKAGEADSNKPLLDIQAQLKKESPNIPPGALVILRKAWSGAMNNWTKAHNSKPATGKTAL